MGEEPGDHIINYQTFTEIKKLGEGSSGAVVLMQDPETNERFAVKLYSYRMSASEKQLFISEASMACKLLHPNIVQIVGFYLPVLERKIEGAIIMEYVEGPCLSLALEKNLLSFDQKVQVMSGIALGMKYIHQLGYLHRDLKPQNIGLTNKFHPKILDFGLTKKSATTNTVGTLRYIAPESTSPKYDNKVDVFSFGMILYEMFVGPIFPGNDEMWIHHQLDSGSRPPMESVSVPQWIIDLIQNCWDQLPTKRPGFADIVELIGHNEPSYLMQYELLELKSRGKKEILQYLKQQQAAYLEEKKLQSQEIAKLKKINLDLLQQLSSQQQTIQEKEQEISTLKKEIEAFKHESPQIQQTIFSPQNIKHGDTEAEPTTHSPFEQREVFEIGNLKYVVTGAEEVEITGYVHNAAIPLCFSSTVDVNGTVFQVRSIGPRAFEKSKFTGDLVLPNSVTTIGEFAFSNCSGFTGSLTIPNSVTTIGNCAFFNCSGFTGSLTIPNSVTTIGEYAFCRCSGFTGPLTIPNSVTTIGKCAFYGCSGFTKFLTIPHSTKIGERAFYRCSGFTGS